MFSYRPPKGSCWGHAPRPRDPDKAREKLRAFFDTYFEPVPPETLASRSFDCFVTWKTSVLPNIDWLEKFLRPGNESMQKTMFMVNLGTAARIMFAGGIMIPISPTEPSSYEFLRKFSADAPFKMSPKHFMVGVAIGKEGNFAWRKPSAEIAARLREVI